MWVVLMFVRLDIVRQEYETDWVLQVQVQHMSLMRSYLES